MKDYLGHKASRLDPRLKRLIHSIRDLSRLAEDKSRLNIASIEEAPVSAEQYTKRVLIRCAIGDQHLDDYSPNVSHIVGRIYSAEVPLNRLEELGRDLERSWAYIHSSCPKNKNRDDKRLQY
jgi:hypothetical protein